MSTAYWESSRPRGGDADEPDDFDEFDPTPYGGGYDLFVAFGRPLQPSEETCYPCSAPSTSYEAPHYSASEPSPYGHHAKPQPAYGFRPQQEQQPSYGGGYGSRPPPAAEEESGGYGSGYGRKKPQEEEQSYGSGYGSGYGRKPQAEESYGSGGYGSGYGGQTRPDASAGYGSGYGSQPQQEESYGSGYGRKPQVEESYGSGYGSKPQVEESYGSGYGRKPQVEESYGSEYGSGYGRKPQAEESYGSGYGSRPQGGDEYGSGGYGRKTQLLYGGFVVNPATRQWARLPPYPPSPDGFEGLRYDVDKCLVFDPTVSPHYEVLLLPYVPFNFEFKGNLLEGTTWPPSPCIIQVFSSRTGRWEQRSFILEGEPAGILADVKLCREPDAQHHAVYWRETVYVYCKGDFLMRLRLTDDNYQVIKLPASTTENEYIQLYLGKSKKGVYLAHPKASTDQLEIWFLNESDHKTEWVLKSSINVKALTKHIYQNHDEQTSKHWILQDRNNDDGNKGLVEEENLDWNSDDDNALNLEDWDPPGFWGYQVFGFHPYKEIIFLDLDGSVVAYHFNISKYQDLGELGMPYNSGHGMDTASIYTPCWIGELSENI